MTAARGPGPQGERGAAHVVIDVEVSSPTPLRGWLVGPSGEHVEFHGILELVAGLERLLRM